MLSQRGGSYAMYDKSDKHLLYGKEITNLKDVSQRNRTKVSRAFI
jgi:hypothetical protein